jgi:hypothetical protein
VILEEGHAESRMGAPNVFPFERVASNVIRIGFMFGGAMSLARSSVQGDRVHLSIRRTAPTCH